MICKTCVLPSTFPRIKFDVEGVCDHCNNFKGLDYIKKRQEKYRKKFETLINSQKSNNHSSVSAYDVLVAYSGGKDSTFTLDLLKNNYGLRVLALTFDHGFISPFAQKNIRKVVEILGVDHITFKPNFQLVCQIFRYSITHEFHPPKAIERASSICNSCMGLVKFVTLRTAIEKEVPFISYGWSPGQAPIQSSILKNHPSFIHKTQQLFLQPLEKAVGSDVRAYFLEDHHLRIKSNVEFPYNINPLAFLHYNEDAIYNRIQELGWQTPQDTDPNSTNCLLNAFANQVHLQRHRYHPYAMEQAELVREGILKREEALNRLAEKPDPKIIEKVKLKLGLDAHIP
jgi:tRNA(Ile)-lysidine synthase TilS/MesJ